MVNDGMIRWDDGQTYIARNLEGFEATGLLRYFDTNTYYRQPVATGPISWKGPITVSDYQVRRRLYLAAGQGDYHRPLYPRQALPLRPSP